MVTINGFALEQYKSLQIYFFFVRKAKKKKKKKKKNVESTVDHIILSNGNGTVRIAFATSGIFPFFLYSVFLSLYTATSSFSEYYAQIFLGRKVNKRTQELIHCKY